MNGAGLAGALDWYAAGRAAPSGAAASVGNAPLGDRDALDKLDWEFRVLFVFDCAAVWVGHRCAVAEAIGVDDR
ncbi:MAG: hypothetical protein ACRECA_08630 [Pseudolabrys sp.]